MTRLIIAVPRSIARRTVHFLVCVLGRIVLEFPVALVGAEHECLSPVGLDTATRFGFFAIERHATTGSLTMTVPFSLFPPWPEGWLSSCGFPSQSGSSQRSRPDRLQTSRA